jgi:hypothetical protein
MSKKIRCINIDGIDKTGKTSVLREIRKYLKEKELDLHEINGTDENKLQLQDILLEDNVNSLILKENSILSLFNEHIKNGSGVMSLENCFRELLRKERDINQKHGSIYFFLIPDSMDVIYNRFLENESSENIRTSYDFFKSINQYSISQGLDIRLVFFNENDKIYDIRDKIIDRIKEDCIF